MMTPEEFEVYKELPGNSKAVFMTHPEEQVIPGYMLKRQKNPGKQYAEIDPHDPVINQIYK